jgi:hypothetical protein
MKIGFFSATAELENSWRGVGILKVEGEGAEEHYKAEVELF